MAARDEWNIIYTISSCWAVSVLLSKDLYCEGHSRLGREEYRNNKLGHYSPPAENVTVWVASSLYLYNNPDDTPILPLVQSVHSNGLKYAPLAP